MTEMPYADNPNMQTERKIWRYWRVLKMGGMDTR